MSEAASPPRDTADPDHLTTTRHDLELRDVRDGQLVVSYNHVREGPTYTEGRHVSTRLPMECIVLFGRDGTVPVAFLTDEQRRWVRFESAQRSNTVDFDGVQR
jgi:hypothetical protein